MQSWVICRDGPFPYHRDKRQFCSGPPERLSGNDERKRNDKLLISTCQWIQWLFLENSYSWKNVRLAFLAKTMDIFLYPQMGWQGTLNGYWIFNAKAPREALILSNKKKPCSFGFDPENRKKQRNDLCTFGRLGLEEKQKFWMTIKTTVWNRYGGYSSSLKGSFNICFGIWHWKLLPTIQAFKYQFRPGQRQCSVHIQMTFKRSNKTFLEPQWPWYKEYTAMMP